MRRLLRAFGLALAAVALAAPPLTAQEAAIVRVDKTRTEPLSQTVPVIGRLVATRSGAVAAEISGLVEQINVEVGDTVRKDQVIAVLDVDTLKAQQDLAVGELAQAQADLQTALAELQLSRQELARLEGLRESGAFPKGRFEDTRQRGRINEAKVGKAEAAVATKKAALRLADLNLEMSEIRAPYDGVVTQRLSEVGAYIKTGDPLVNMISDSALEVEADVPFRRLQGLRAGSEVDLILDDGSRHRAVLRAILPTENPMTRTRTARFVPHFADPRTRLADAQSVTLRIPVGERRKVVTVHKDAIINRNGRNLVYVVAHNAAQPRQIEIGEAVGSRIEVRGGLSEGETVVIRGNERLLPGARVRVDNGPR